MIPITRPVPDRSCHDEQLFCPVTLRETACNESAIMVATLPCNLSTGGKTVPYREILIAVEKAR